MIGLAGFSFSGLWGLEVVQTSESFFGDCKSLWGW